MCVSGHGAGVHQALVLNVSLAFDARVVLLEAISDHLPDWLHRLVVFGAAAALDGVELDSGVRVALAGLVLDLIDGPTHKLIQLALLDSCDTLGPSNGVSLGLALGSAILSRSCLLGFSA